MGLLDSILGAASGERRCIWSGESADGNCRRSPRAERGLQGLANKFAQSGQGNAFQSWVGMGENQPVSSNQIQNVLGSEQVNAIATKMGVDPAMVSTFLAEYLPKIVDKLTPAGKIDPAADHQQGLAALLPSLLQSLSGQSSGDQSARQGVASWLDSIARRGEHLYNERIRRQQIDLFNLPVFVWRSVVNRSSGTPSQSAASSRSLKTRTLIGEP